MSRVVMNPTFKAEMGRPENSRPWQREAGLKAQVAISSHAPVRFGTLANTIYVSFGYERGTTYIFWASTRPYAAFQEHGTGLYGPLKRYITPKRAKFLSWVDTSPGVPGGPEGGMRRYAKKVKGTPPTLFMFRGLTDVFGPAQTESYAATGGRYG